MALWWFYEYGLVQDGHQDHEEGLTFEYNPSEATFLIVFRKAPNIDSYNQSS